MQISPIEFLPTSSYAPPALMTMMSPSSSVKYSLPSAATGDAVNVLETRVGGDWSEVARFTGYTESLDVLEWTADDPVEGVEAFRVTTLESSSWPEWFEFEIDAVDS